MKASIIILLAMIASSVIAQSTQSKLEQLDSLYQEEINPQKKLGITSEMLDLARSNFGTNDTTYAKMLSKVGSVYIDIALDSALHYLQEAISIQKKLTPKSAAYANTLNKLGIVYYYQRDLVKTEKHWKEAIAIRKSVFGENHISYLGSVVNLGNLLLDLGKYNSAATTYKDAQLIFERQEKTDHQFYMICLTNLAIVHEYLGDYATAEQYYIKTLTLQEKALGEEHPTYLVTMGYLASLYRLMGEYERAESQLLLILEKKKKTLGENHYSYATSLNSLGNLYLSNKEYDKAISYYRKDLEICKKQTDPDNLNLAGSYGNLGLLHHNIKKYEIAESYFNLQLNLLHKIVGKQHPKYADALNSLGGLYFEQEQFDKAEKLYLEALQITQSSFAPQHPNVINEYNRLASLYIAINDTAKALKHLEKALRSNSNSLIGADVSNSWDDIINNNSYLDANEIIFSLEALYNYLGLIESKDQQFEICLSALKILQQSKNKLQAESDQLRYLTKSADWVLRSLQATNLEENADQAFNAIEQNKTVLLLDALNSKQMQRSGFVPEDIIIREKELQKHYAQVKATLSESSDPILLDSLRAVFNDINQETDKLQAELQENHPRYATSKYQYDVAKIENVQNLIDDQTAILEYLIGDSILYIFYIDKQNIHIRPVPLQKNTLQNKIDAFHNALSNYQALAIDEEKAYFAYTRNAHWFYQNLIAPVLDNNDKSTLIIIPDGTLGNIPFECFLRTPAPQTPSEYSSLDYLLKSYTISYNYSATLWAENKQSAKRDNNGLLLGVAADYHTKKNVRNTYNRLASEERIRKALLPLPAAQQEVEALRANFKGLFVTDSLASERFFKNNAKDYAIIHLAMHGLLNHKDPALSSLAFTENGDSLENNFLQAFEIAQMDLNADLIVLSACETGYGRFEHGNGIASLARSFMYAGVPSSVVSLWQVNDFATAELMQYFYNNLTEGIPKDKALQLAKQQYLDSSLGIAAHPAFWSPFILIGNNDPIEISTKGSFGNTIWWLLGGIVLLLGIWQIAVRAKSA